MITDLANDEDETVLQSIGFVDVASNVAIVTQQAKRGLCPFNKPVKTAEIVTVFHGAMKPALYLPDWYQKPMAHQGGYA